MSDTGAISPGTGADDTSVGTLAWANPGNILAADGTLSSATATANVTSHYLKATNFGFSIPSGATINGIVVEIKKKKTSGVSVKDNLLKLVKGGTIGGSSNADTATAWSATLAYVTYGTSSDLWGNTLTDTDVNASNFGVALSTTISASGKLNTIASVDHIRITVYYTAVTGSIGIRPFF